MNVDSPKKIGSFIHSTKMQFDLSLNGNLRIIHH